MMRESPWSYRPANPTLFKHVVPRQPCQIRRAFRNLVTRAHPDKGGDAARFRLIQQAYEVLSDPSKASPGRARHEEWSRQSTPGSTHEHAGSLPGCPINSFLPPPPRHVQRSHYDQTGKIIKSAEEEFMDSFAGGVCLMWEMALP